jgi:hypothetical protein
VEASNGTIFLYYLQSCSKILCRATEGAVIQVPHIDLETRYLSLDAFHYRLQCESKTQWTQRITLLNSTLAEDGSVAKVEKRLGPIAALHPGSHRGNLRSYFFKRAGG